MSTEAHEFIAPNFGSDSVPECSCGWVSVLVLDYDEAILKWEDHCDDVFYKATMGERG